MGKTLKEKTLANYKEKFEKYYEDVEIFVGEYLRVSDEEHGFELIYWEQAEKFEELLKKVKEREEMKVRKVYCACGSEMKAVMYIGYYDEFKYLECSNEDCDYLDFQEADGENKGAYTI